MNGRKSWCWVVIALGALAQQGFGALYVSAHAQNAQWPYTNWNIAASSIQDAVNAAPAGETVYVAAGIYDYGESVISNAPVETSLSNRVIITSAITVVSTGGPAATIIVGTGPLTNWAVRCVCITNGLLAGFTLSNGYTRQDGDWRFDGSGGAVLNLGGIVSNCLITSSHAFYYGGGAASGTYVDCVFENNHADFGGGGAFWATLQRCVFRGNHVDTWGGAVYGCAAYNSLMTSNVALFGGASFMSQLANCTLSRNVADFEGGGSYWDTVENSIVYDNSATHAPDAFESEFSFSCTALPVTGANNITNAPGFRNAFNDFRLTCLSPCRNAGNLAYVNGTTDLDGHPRVIEGRVDMGAYEYDPAFFAPFIDITNAVSPPAMNWVPYHRTSFAAAGTNWNVYGNMAWCLSVNYTNWFYHAGTAWGATATGLVEGWNSLTIIGTNFCNVWTTDTIRIYRQTSNEVAPCVDITNAYRTLPVGTTRAGIGGTNLNIAAGNLWWSNNRAAGVFPFKASGENGWFTNIIHNLLPGTNVITVAGTNLYGWPAADTCLIFVGWPLPVIDITNAPAIVSYHVSNAWVSGTNDNIAGKMGWSLNGSSTNWFARADSNWMVNVTGLLHGDNLVSIIGTNVWDMWTNDIVWIHRETSNEVAPCVDITNSYLALSAGTTSVGIAGTNANIAAGNLWWSNNRVAGVFPFKASGKNGWFTNTIHNLLPGTNVITVAGTNMYGWPAADSLPIFVGWPLPVIDITNAPAIVKYHLDNAWVSGTNKNIAGSMVWKLNAGPATNWFARAGSGWTTNITGLVYGDNTVYILGTNAWDMWTNDSVIIHRETSNEVAPCVDVTNAYRELPIGATSAVIGGTNLNIAAGNLWWWNDRGPGVFPFKASGANGWFANAVNNLQPGTNVITVAGTNLYGWPAADTCLIFVGWPLAFVDITNVNATVDYSIMTCAIGGTNMHVVGQMWWTNLLTAGNGTLPATSPWLIANIELEVGANTIVVAGRNMAGITAADTITVTRLPEPLPFIDITNVLNDVVVTNGYEVDWLYVAGTNLNLFGNMGWYVNDGQTNWFAPSGVSWAVTLTGLWHGDNLVTILGTNAWHSWTNDKVRVYRRSLPDVAPFVDVTNKYQEFLYGTTNAVVAGTNYNVVALWIEDWSNNMAWSANAFQADIFGLHTGTNLIVVNGTNQYDHYTNDTAIIFVEPEPRPFIDITNTYGPLPFPNNQITLGVTNVNVARVLTFTNEATGDTRTFPATPDLVISNITLVVGSNVMRVWGYSQYGMLGAATVSVERLPALPPFVDITNPSPRMVYESLAAINGTNGSETYLVYCSNALTHAVVQPFQWGDAIDLIEATQDIIVLGTNGVGTVASDVCQITYHIRRPKIFVMFDDVILTNGAVVDCGIALTGRATLAYFTLGNAGDAPLTNDLVVFGAVFSVSQSPASIVAPTNESPFITAFLPVLTGDYAGTLCITNNDLDSTPFIINLRGAAVATFHHIWYSTCRLNTGIRCEFHYNAAENPKPDMDAFCFMVNNSVCLNDRQMSDPAYWHYSRAAKSYVYRNKIAGSGRVVVTLDTKRQQGSIFIKKLLLPTEQNDYLPISFTLGALDTFELPYFSGAGKSTREHTEVMGFQSNLVVVTDAQVRFKKKSVAADDVLLLRGVCFTNAAVVLGNQFTARFSWRMLGASMQVFDCVMKRAANNVCYAEGASNLTAWINFAKGRWELKATGLNLVQPQPNQAVVLETRLQLGADPAALDETVHYRARSQKNRNILY